MDQCFKVPTWIKRFLLSHGDRGQLHFAGRHLGAAVNGHRHRRCRRRCRRCRHRSFLVSENGSKSLRPTCSDLIVRLPLERPENFPSFKIFKTDGNRTVSNPAEILHLHSIVNFFLQVTFDSKQISSLHFSVNCHQI